MNLLYTHKKYLFKVLLLLSLACVRLYGGIEPVSIPSAAMKRSFNALVILPDDYTKSSKRYPVLYLLHGHSSDPGSWYFVLPELTDWATKEQMIMVCPDGDFDSWYLDSPRQPKRKFASYIAEEVAAFVDQHYRTIKERSARGISGISMGGHGAFFLALQYPQLFGLAGSSSGGLDLLPFSGYWNLDHLLGDPRSNNWRPYSCLQLLDCISFQNQQVWMDCGSDDFFIEGNRAFHQKLLAKNIPHQYVETSGGHDLSYWKSAYPDQLRFFSKHFKRE